MERTHLLEGVARRVASVEVAHAVRVAIDGPDGAGKTTLAEALIAPVRRLGRSVIRASVDGFHNPRRVRYQRGRESPEGYYRDSFDYARLEACLLRPLGPDGDGRYRSAVFDHRTDGPIASPVERAAPGAVLLFDGVFLLRPEIRTHWDLTLYLDAPLDTAIERALERDGIAPGTEPALLRRYVEGQRLYQRECRPADAADVVIDHSDPARPRIVRE